MLIDTHAHLNFSAFDKDRDEVIKRSLENKVWFINIGTKYETSTKAVEITRKYAKGVFAAVGLHPIHLEERKVDAWEIRGKEGFETKGEEFDYAKYKELAKSEKVVAIGEIGLDYYYKPKTKRKLELFKQEQKEVLLSQLKLSKELNLPVIFHCRFALDELIEILMRTVLQPLRGVIHCFTGDWEQAQKYLEMGFHLGFNGIIFRLNLDEIIQKIPLDKILIETDCPYLSPPPYQNERNEPLYVKYIAQKIAKIKNLSFEKIAKISTENAKKLFNLK